jgi:hypothetical protein
MLVIEELKHDVEYFSDLDIMRLGSVSHFSRTNTGARSGLDWHHVVRKEHYACEAVKNYTARWIWLALPNVVRCDRVGCEFL